MTETTLSTETSELLDTLAAKWAVSSDPRQTRFDQCEAAYLAIGGADTSERNPRAKAFALKAGLAVATLIHPNDPEAAQAAAEKSAQQGGQKVSHTTVLQRAQGWALAILAGEPDIDLVYLTSGLAARTKSGAATLKDAILKDASIVGDRDKVVAAVKDAIETIDNPAPKTEDSNAVAPNTGTTVIYTVQSLLDNLSAAMHDKHFLDGIDDDTRANLHAAATSLVRSLKK